MPENPGPPPLDSFTPAGPQPGAIAMRPFRYRAQTTDGRVLDGRIDATDADDAHFRLREMGLIIIDIEGESKPRPRALRGDDFAAFNQQLAHLTAAGMPVERGLRLIAQDMKGGRLAETIRSVARSLEQGRSLPEAFEAHRSHFPPIYAQLMQAGISSGNLPGMLLNIGRHLELVTRLRRSIWRAMLYPMLVFIALAGLIIFFTLAVLPAFEAIFIDWDMELPALTKLVMDSSMWLPAVMIAGIAGLLLLPLVLSVLRRSGETDWLMDRVLVRIPLLGPVLRDNLIARWLDVLHIGLKAGLDLPAAISLSGNAIGSSRLQHDGRQLSEALASGRSVETISRQLLPATVPAAIELAPSHGDLPGVIADMSRLYEQQADLRLGFMEVLLAPITLLIVGAVISVIILAMFLPLVSITQSVT